MRYFCIFSKIRGRFLVPFPAWSLSDAIDQIAATIADRSNSMLIAFPEDCRIYEIGDFDCKTGVFVPCDSDDPFARGFDLMDFDQIKTALEYADKLYKDAAEANAIARLRFEAEQAKASGRQAMEVDVNG